MSEAAVQQPKIATVEPVFVSRRATATALSVSLRTVDMLIRTRRLRTRRIGRRRLVLVTSIRRLAQ